MSISETNLKMTQTDIPHQPYASLETFRPALISQYLSTYTHDIIVQEKIHGSNIIILGVYSRETDTWEFKLGSRKKWITMKDRFNNFQILFKSHEESILSLFDTIKNKLPESEQNGTVIRLFGEIFGGKYGQQTDKGAFKTQSDPNYCPYNDFAFFDIYLNDTCIPILDSHQYIQDSGLKIAPVIFKGQLSAFLKDFNIETFTSVVSHRFYNLAFIDTPKSTEGVTIRTTKACSEDSDESCILKYKQAWITENRRSHYCKPTRITDDVELTEECLAMLNKARLDAYNSKHTLDDMTNPRLLTQHTRDIIEDTVDDIKKEFPNNSYPNLNIKMIKGKLSRKCFPMLKEYIKSLNNATLSVDMRIDNLEHNTTNVAVELNMIRQRITHINSRIH